MIMGKDNFIKKYLSKTELFNLKVFVSCSASR